MNDNGILQAHKCFCPELYFRYFKMVSQTTDRGYDFLFRQVVHMFGQIHTKILKPTETFFPLPKHPVEMDNGN
jgi:hypothetical protein